MNRQVNALDKKLQEFRSAVRQLGSSIGLLSSSYWLRQRLSVVLRLFRENAESLFPKYIGPKPEPLHASTPSKWRKAGGLKVAQLRRPTISAEYDAEDLPTEMSLLARDVMSFLDQLEAFPEFHKGTVNASMVAFQNDLKVTTVSPLTKAPRS